MLLKRLYDWDAPKDDWPVNKEGNRVPPIRAIALLHTGTTPEQNFSIRLVEQGMREGWLRIVEGNLFLLTEQEELIYNIDVMPGRYCCHCGEKLMDDDAGHLARLHVEAEHKGKPSPDAESPAGYCKVNAFLCTLDPMQHEQYKFGAQDRKEKPEAAKIDLRAMRRGVDG